MVFELAVGLEPNYQIFTVSWIGTESVEYSMDSYHWEIGRDVCTFSSAKISIP